jgi:hypothetical protein
MSCIPIVQFWAPDDGRKDRPKHVEFYAKINQFEKLVHLVCMTIGIYYDARTCEVVNHNLHLGRCVTLFWMLCRYVGSTVWLAIVRLRYVLTNSPRKWSLIIFCLHLPTNRTKSVLRIIQLYTHLIFRSSSSILNYSDSIYRLCPAMRTNWVIW